MVSSLSEVSFHILSTSNDLPVANARIEGLVTDLHITGNQYLTGLTLYFIGYVLFEVPCNIILKRTTPKFWLPTLTLSMLSDTKNILRQTLTSYTSSLGYCRYANG